ncbi:hypothetical protein QVD17_39763 [Tagetes erecta]|uniref:RNA-directed DNA polymerase, eukaryota, reverse transcriptase zinc-binding domain protein n=1 Tax=Tagetes erecta TaxID=13708 RepID=A0AAD8JP46_TARER|nr:hypothetical protein QVD17_39763 [Tagetes erecta]
MPVQKHKQKFEYRPIDRNKQEEKKDDKSGLVNVQRNKQSDGTSSSYNRFQVLEDQANECINIGTTSRSIAKPEGGDISDDDCENVFDETAEFLLSEDDQLLRDKEAKGILDYQTACLDEESFLKQKSKVHWLAKGDANTRFFHNYLKGKNHRSRIHSIVDSNGTTWEGDLMIDAFVLHYKNFLGGQHNASLHPTDDIFVNRLNHQLALGMIEPVEREEIRQICRVLSLITIKVQYTFATFLHALSQA